MIEKLSLEIIMNYALFIMNYELFFGGDARNGKGL